MSGKDCPSHRFRHTFTATWTFRSPVQQARLQLRLRPRDATQVLAHTCNVDPSPGRFDEALDNFGNHLVLAEVSGVGSQLNVSAQSDFECLPIPEESIAAGIRPWEELLVVADAGVHPPLEVGLADSKFAAFSRPSFRADRPWLEAVLELACRLRHEMHYDTGVAADRRDAREIFESRRGTCQDRAQVMLACLRSQGITAGFVQGCLLQPGPAGSDRSHAWVRVFEGGSRWRDIDPSTGERVEQAVPLAWGWDASNVAPVQGEILGGGRQLLTVTQWVEPM